MKTKQLICTLFSLLVAVVQISFVSSAKASPVQYQVSGSIGGWCYCAGLDPSQFPIPVNTAFSATFTYDSSIPVSFATNDAYRAFSNLVGVIGNNQFSSTDGDALFALAGSMFGGVFRGNTFQGFNVNGLTLTTVGIVYPSPPTTALPASLPQTPSIVAFDFSDGNNIYEFYSASATVNPVPIPSAIWFFTSSLLGLIGVSRRKLK